MDTNLTYRQGLIQIYTGEGKGKTTAAVGLTVRAVSYGWRVGYIYFHKDPSTWGYGELTMLKKVGVDVYGFALKHPAFFPDVTPAQMRAECISALEFIDKLFSQNRFDLVVLDEILISVRDKYLTEDELIGLCNRKPLPVELVLTGRGATTNLVNKADLVSEIKNIKHPYDTDLISREGIEY